MSDKKPRPFKTALKVKIGEHQFDAHGSEEFVLTQYEKWLVRITAGVAVVEGEKK